MDPNSVLKMDFNVAAWGVVIHGFENAALDTWVSQDWSAYGGISFWLYGNNSGTDLFVDVIDNRNSPPHTNDDAERFSITLKDNFSGWKQIELPFASFTRKEIGNGAPNDGFTLTEVHGWAIGTADDPRSTDVLHGSCHTVWHGARRAADGGLCRQQHQRERRTDGCDRGQAPANHRWNR